MIGRVREQIGKKREERRKTHGAHSAKRMSPASAKTFEQRTIEHKSLQTAPQVIILPRESILCRRVASLSQSC